jgi:hypothetical protein
MVTNRSFYTQEDTDRCVEEMAIDVRADENILPGTVVLAIDEVVYRLSATDAMRLGSILTDMGRAALHIQGQRLHTSD